MNFDQLAHAIDRIHTNAQSRAGQAINQVLNWRNWLIGAYIIEFEQGGEDRPNTVERFLPQLLMNVMGLRRKNRTWMVLLLPDMKQLRMEAT